MLSCRPDCKTYLESTVGGAWRMEDLQSEVSLKAFALPASGVVPP